MPGAMATAVAIKLGEHMKQLISQSMHEYAQQSIVRPPVTPTLQTEFGIVGRAPAGRPQSSGGVLSPHGHSNLREMETASQAGSDSSISRVLGVKARRPPT